VDRSPPAAFLFTDTKKPLIEGLFLCNQ